MAKAAAFASGGRDLGDQFVELLPIARRYRYARALARQGQRAGMADALRRSRDQRHSSFEFHECSLGKPEIITCRRRQTRRFTVFRLLRHKLKP